MSNLFFLEEQLWYYLTYSWEDKGVHTFSKGICPKGNVIAWQEFELAYFDSAVQRFNYYNMRTPFPGDLWGFAVTQIPVKDH